jgi:hypothetical protein
MAYLVTRAEMVAKVRLRAELDESSYVTDEEITTELNAGINAVWREVMRVNPDYYVLEDEFNTTGVSDYALPDDFLAMRSVNFVTSSGDLSAIRRFEMGEMSRQQRSSHYRYRLLFGGMDGSGVRLRILPAPDSGRTVRYYYVQTPTRLVADGDEWDAIVDLDEFPIEFACWKLRARGQEDFSSHVLAWEKMPAHVAEVAARRDVSAPSRIAKVRVSHRRRRRRPY